MIEVSSVMSSAAASDRTRILSVSYRLATLSLPQLFLNLPEAPAGRGVARLPAPGAFWGGGRRWRHHSDGRYSHASAGEKRDIGAQLATAAVGAARTRNRREASGAHDGGR
jgi:hypothetical protein